MRHTTMDMQTSATIVIRLDDGSKVGFNGGPLDYTPDQGLDFERRLEEMGPVDACAYLDQNGWTRFGVEQEPCTDHPVPRDRAEAALRFLIARLSLEALDRSSRAGLAAILDRCPWGCPHGDRCTLGLGHEGGHNFTKCGCNEPLVDTRQA